jgi:hypothetical protein
MEETILKLQSQQEKQVKPTQIYRW